MVFLFLSHTDHCGQMRQVQPSQLRVQVRIRMRRVTDLSLIVL